MDLYGCFCPIWVLAPGVALGIAAQAAVYQEVLFPVVPLPLPCGLETQTGWAALPDELLARVMEAAKAATGSSLHTLHGAPRGQVAPMSRLHRGDGSAELTCSLRLVCRAWRRVHDERLVTFLKPTALFAEVLSARFPGLVALDCSRAKYPDRAALAALLGRLPALRSLTLKDVGGGPRLAAALSEALPRGALAELNMSANGLAGRGAAALAGALRLPGCSLRSLNLRDNIIPSEGAVAIAEALRVNSSLTELDLSANPLGMAGAVALSGALVHNPVLRELNLGGCMLGDDGCQALAQGLAQFSALRSLSLYSNGITDRGISELAAAAAKNCGALCSLELRGNTLAAAGAQALLAAAEANDRLTQIHLDEAAPYRALGGAMADAAEDETLAVLLTLAALLESRRLAGQVAAQNNGARGRR